MNLETSISALIPADQAILQALEQEYHRVHLPKNELIFPMGTVAKHIFYLEKGLARMFYYNEAGKDITYEFFAEGNFMAPSESFLEQKPSVYSIELLEDAELRYVSADGLNRLLENFPVLEKIKSHILAHFLFQANRRIVALQFQNAQQRYETLETDKGNILQRAPLGHIASYLGITQETLSRIRGRK
jgi:CRP-like cAMP-binding protein